MFRNDEFDACVALRFLPLSCCLLMISDCVLKRFCCGGGNMQRLSWSSEIVSDRWCDVFGRWNVKDRISRWTIGIFYSWTWTFCWTFFWEISAYEVDFYIWIGLLVLQLCVSLLICGKYCDFLVRFQEIVITTNQSKS